MKVKEVKVGEIFTIDSSWVRPKLKLKQGFLDMATQYIWVCWEEHEAEVLTDIQIIKIARNWRLTLEQFERHKQKMVKKYIEEVNK